MTVSDVVVVVRCDTVRVCSVPGTVVVVVVVPMEVEVAVTSTVRVPYKVVLATMLIENRDTVFSPPATVT